MYFDIIINKIPVVRAISNFCIESKGALDFKSTHNVKNRFQFESTTLTLQRFYIKNNVQTSGNNYFHRKRCTEQVQRDLQDIAKFVQQFNRE